jgi:hypothetical protein
MTTVLRNIVLTCGIAALLLGAPLSATAGFDAGLAAYQRNEGRTALRHLLPLAQRGNAEAQYYVGRLYFYPELGARQDYRASAAWFTRAAAQGHAAAQYKLGGMYFAGRGVAQDDRLAVAWWRRAAEQGHGEAQNNLGALFANGRGVPRNTVAAYALQSLALANGNELAAENLRAKEAIMTPAELAAARQLAQDMAVAGALPGILDDLVAPPDADGAKP